MPVRKTVGTLAFGGLNDTIFKDLPHTDSVISPTIKTCQANRIKESAVRTRQVLNKAFIALTQGKTVGPMVVSIFRPVVAKPILPTTFLKSAENRKDLPGRQVLIHDTSPGYY